MSERAGWGFEEGEELRPGRVVLSSLGGGSRYEVFVVWDDALFALAVAKVLRPDQAEDEKARRDLAREVDALEAMSHPALVRCFDAELDGERPHILVEHLEGPSLRRLIKRDGALPLEQIVPLAANVAGALQYMEQEGYVHLDVKPDNIIMGVPPRLIDLSIARTVARAAETDGPIGTDAYMAPEQCVAAGERGAIGPATDSWGLGATLWHAITGEKPFLDGWGEEGAGRFPQLDEKPLPLPSRLPDGLGRLLIELLDPDPSARPGGAEVVERLEPILATLPSRARFAKRGSLGV